MAFSDKQRKILKFPYSKYDALICDGAVRSGKTSIMSLSFFYGEWVTSISVHLLFAVSPLELLSEIL